MSHITTNKTSSFSINVPQSVLYSDNLVSNFDTLSRLQEIDKALEKIFAVENRLSCEEEIAIANMQMQIKTIELKYVSTDREMIPLDALRICRFRERIDAIYAENEPRKEDFLYAEILMEEREELLLKA